MQRAMHRAPRITQQISSGHTPAPALLIIDSVSAHQAYLAALAGLGDLMVRLSANSGVNPSVPIDEIVKQLSAAADHAKDRCPTCTDPATARIVLAAEVVFCQRAQEYMHSEHQRTSSSLVELTLPVGDEDDPDAPREYPLLDLMAILASRH